MAWSYKTLCCSFCGKDKDEVKKLVAGPTVFICNDCIDICVGIIRNDVETNGELLDDYLPITTGKTTSSQRTSKHKHH